MTDMLGYIAALLIGVSLGLIGGGGSILTVPVLVYLFGISPLLATSYSLLVVGATSLAGAWSNYLEGFVEIKTALLFGISSITTVFLTRKLLIPLIPHSFDLLNIHFTLAVLTMVLFAILMILAAIAMIRNSADRACEPGTSKANRLGKLLFYGLIIGLITGLLGAGGGFLLVPTLVLIVKMPMKKAVGTSLFIIALNSLIGFTGDIGHFAMDWHFLLKITGIAVAGIIVGSLLNKRIPGEQLKTGFGWFIMGMGLLIIVKEAFF